MKNKRGNSREILFDDFCQVPVKREWKQRLKLLAKMQGTSMTALIRTTLNEKYPQLTTDDQDYRLDQAEGSPEAEEEGVSVPA